MTEAEVLEYLRRGDHQRAVTALLGLFGAEVYGYVRSLVKDDDSADDAFAVACESVLNGIMNFRGDSSLRTWFYAIARNAAFRELERTSRQKRARASIQEDQLVAALRTATAEYRKTENRDRIAQLRLSLSAHERELLSLRIDRQLSWEEIAAICTDRTTGEEVDLKKAAARHRQQFMRAKERLRELARQAGLL